jgi:signal transduction histidine kinase
VKLRTQFVLLVVGIIAVPFFVSALVLLVRYTAARGREPLPNYSLISAWVRRQVPRAMREHELKALSENRPPGLDIIVLNRSDAISFSTIPDFSPGAPVDWGSLLGFIRKNADEFHFQIETPHATNPRQYRGTQERDESLVILKLPKIRPERASLRTQAFQVITYSTLALLVFSSLMSFLILRSLNRSILTLEGATRRIAGGDLDFELPARGNDRIASLTRSFDSMRRALKEEYARRARFIMGVSHDLRTPLTLIQGYVEAIADGFAAEPDAQKRYLSIILDKTRVLEDMVGDLIEFVRMETGEWRMTHHDVPLKAFLEEIARRFAEDALILRREFASSIELPEEATVRMDEGLFTRVLENLVGNAIRYSEEKGKIAMSARAEAEMIVLSMSDTGIGIPDEDLGRIFDPFYRGTNSRREVGFGLGLTTVKSIIESHGWNITVASGVGKGTTFTIRMPMVRRNAS